jgi:hypothetical protein
MTLSLRYLAAAAFICAAPLDVAAQHITLKTVPIPLGEQFQILPSRNLGMGSVRVALDDALLDPFTNPARGAFTDRLRVYVLPTIYGEANNVLSGRSFPVAVSVPGERLFGSVAFAMQQVDNPDRFNWAPVQNDESVFQENASSNIYAQATLGLRLSSATSIGASFFHADLDAVDAVNLLYGRSMAIDQDGTVTDARVGATHDFGLDRTLDVVVLRSSVDMTHDVLYQEWTWPDPIQWQGSPQVRSWRELNEDRTITWGAHLRYRQPIGSQGTHVGFILSGSTKAHPKIPNYNVVNIPRDPGNTTAFNIGAGISNITPQSAFSMELIYEPGRSHTWAYADTAVATPVGVLLPGEKTVDNQFRYGNWNVAMGIERDWARAGFQLGLRVHQTRYSLDQQNFLTATRRKTDERWVEWAPSWGGVLHLGDFDLRYTGRFTAKGWPDVGFGGTVADAVSPGVGVDFIVGPTGPVSLPEFRVTMHRLMVSVPFGF